MVSVPRRSDYGYFEAKDILKIGALLSMSILTGVLLALLAAFYWPLIGLVLKP